MVFLVGFFDRRDYPLRPPTPRSFPRKLGLDRVGGGGGALGYGLAIMCRTTLGSGGGGRDSKGEIGGQ